MQTTRPHHAAPPHPPKPTRTLARARQAAETHRTARAALERRSILRGTLIVIALILVFSLTRAGLDRTFPPHWWHW